MTPTHLDRTRKKSRVETPLTPAQILPKSTPNDVHACKKTDALTHTNRQTDALCLRQAVANIALAANANLGIVIIMMIELVKDTHTHTESLTFDKVNVASQTQTHARHALARIKPCVLVHTQHYVRNKPSVCLSRSLRMYSNMYVRVYANV